MLQKYSYRKRIKNQSPKLQKLRDKALNKRTEKQNKFDAVLSLSSRQLSKEETEVLALGFNFRPSLPDLPIKDYIVATESYIKKANLDETTGAEIRNAIIRETDRMMRENKRKPQRTNLSAAQ